MFRSYKYLDYNKENKRCEYEITDSDFVVIVKSIGSDWVFSITLAVIREYTRRNLSVAKNLILLCLYVVKEDEYSMKDVISYQDRYCPEYIDNWVEIAAERDRLLDKLYAMK